MTVEGGRMATSYRPGGMHPGILKLASATKASVRLSRRISGLPGYVSSFGSARVSQPDFIR